MRVSENERLLWKTYQCQCVNYLLNPFDQNKQLLGLDKIQRRDKTMGLLVCSTLSTYYFKMWINNVKCENCMHANLI